MNNHVYIIAEAGVNHNGSVKMALKLIDAAVNAGADAVKFQTFRADRLVAQKAPKAEYQYKATDADETQFEMLRKLELADESYRILLDYCKEKEIEFLSTPFDCASAELLALHYDLNRIKISSGDLTNAPLLLKIAQTKKPVILSTGMSTLSEIEQALGILAFGYLGELVPSIEAFQQSYCSMAGQIALLEKVILLHCTTEYPTPHEDVNLRAMDTLQQAFGLPVGYSDHTVGTTIPIAAAARGAVIIEKHFTLDRSLPGPDHRASLEPEELTRMVQSIREVEQALGSTTKKPAQSELNNRLIARKSILAARPISIGEIFTENNLTIMRPGNGMPPIHYWGLLGKKADRKYETEDPVIIWHGR